MRFSGFDFMKSRNWSHFSFRVTSFGFSFSLFWFTESGDDYKSWGPTSPNPPLLLSLKVDESWLFII